MYGVVGFALKCGQPCGTDHAGDGGQFSLKKERLSFVNQQEASSPKRNGLAVAVARSCDTGHGPLPQSDGSSGA